MAMLSDLYILYHRTSGQICHAPGQDPSHSDDNITQYMQQGLLQPMLCTDAGGMHAQVHAGNSGNSREQHMALIM